MTVCKIEKVVCLPSSTSTTLPCSFLGFFGSTWTMQSILHNIKFKATYYVNLRFLLLLSADIESNPGPTWEDYDCPCEEEIVAANGKLVLFITCKTCSRKWHVKCVGLEGITESPLRKLANWNCPLCYTLPAAVNKEQKDESSVIKNLRQEMKDMETRICDTIKKNEEKANKPTYAQMTEMMTNIQQKQQQGNKLLKEVVKQKRSSETPDEELERQKRTCIVLQPVDPKIKTSKDIRHALKPKFPLIAFKHVRNTVGGVYSDRIGRG